ncbi:MAG: alpha/beta hydrolase [Bacteroidota bacterium]
MIRIKIGLLILCVLSICSCEKSEWLSEGETFYLENKDAVMPVWVNGNTASGTFIIVNHGGAGYTTSLDFHQAKSFQQLEEHYAIVYWDQRMSGMAKGDPRVSDLSIELHIEDLEKLIILITQKYNPNSLFIHGHSWGGALSLGYLGKGNNQQLIKGWINEDGGLQDQYEMILRRAWTVEKANNRYNETGDASWLEIEEWWDDNPDANEGDFEPFQFVRDLGGYIYDEDAANALHDVNRFNLNFRSPYTRYWRGVQYDDTEWLAGYDFMPQARSINIPTLMLWGVEDGSVPVRISDTLYTILGTPENNKFSIQYEACAHSPHWEKPDEFYSEVFNFIEAYK